MSDASDRQIPATPRRRQAAVEAGLLPTTAAIASIASLAAVLACLPPSCRIVADSAVESLRAVLRSPTADGLSDALRPTIAIATVTVVLLLLVLAATVSIRLLLEPVRFRPSRCLPELSRLDPVRGAARMASWRTAGRIGWSLLATAALACVAASVVSPLAMGLGESIGADPLATLSTAWNGLWPMLAAAAGIAAVEWGFARLRFERRIRMTPQEYREELRSLEADPRVRLQRHEARRATLRRTVQARQTSPVSGTR